VNEMQLKITADGANLADLQREVAAKHPEILLDTEPVRGGGFVAELIVALGSAGAFTTLYHIIRAYLGRNASKKLLIASPKGRIEMVGHTAQDEAVVLGRLGFGSEERPADKSAPPAPRKAKQKKGGRS
jgi:hypothetical protein